MHRFVITSCSSIAFDLTLVRSSLIRSSNTNTRTPTNTQTGPLKNVIYDGYFENKPQSYPGPSGAMSSLLPALDAFMGIKLSNAKLSKMLRSFESHMPEPHRAFLHRIRSFEHSNIRDTITSLCSSGTTEAAALVQKYNAVIDRILDFRWRHLHFVRKFIVEQSPEASRASGM